MKKIVLRHADAAALLLDYEQNLRKGRAFAAAETGVTERERCELVIAHPERETEVAVAAEAVWIGPTGVGFEFVNFDAEAKKRLAEFIADEDVDADERNARNIHERVRKLTNREREELARRGSLPERTALERAFGGSVWEGLLQNPQLTPPEVARIARNGSLPKPLVTTIVSNAAWLASAEVQRALMSNPRCTGAQLERVLRSLKPAEVVRLSQQCPYRAEVRALALRLVGKV
jgi:hypothetical protein